RVCARAARRRLAPDPLGNRAVDGDGDSVERELGLCLGFDADLDELEPGSDHLSRRDSRLQHRGLHLFARGGCASADTAFGGTRSPAGSAPDQRAVKARLAQRHPLHHRSQRPCAGSELVSKKKLPQSVQIAIAVAALLFVAVAGYFVLVKPQKGKATDLSTEIAAQDQQISEARALLAQAKHAQKFRVADLFRLTKAMPDQPDEAGIVLELSNVAR